MARRPRRKDVPPEQPRTLLAQRRVQAGLSQVDLADLTGVSRSTIQRLERGLVSDPTVRTLNNLAIALDCRLEDLIEPDWRTWMIFDKNRRKPPDCKTVARYRLARESAPGPRVH